MSKDDTYGEHSADLDVLYCDECGEMPATVHLTEASLCDEDFESTMREILGSYFDYKLCCTLTWSNETPFLCLEEYGVEHDHD